jgi:hypothetical protein
MQGVLDKFLVKDSFSVDDVKALTSHINDYHNLKKRIVYGTVLYQDMEYNDKLQQGARTSILTLRAFKKQYNIAWSRTME